MKPLIGITVESSHDPDDLRTKGKLELNWNYAQTVAEAGGVPLIIPPMADMAVIASLIDGWLIPGGADIDASHFGEENHPEAKVEDPTRFLGEKALYEAASTEMPIFGICYGCQFLNVVRGGNLIQHLPDKVADPHTGGVLQTYEVKPESKLGAIIGTESATGKSYHHQAVDRAGAGLRVVAQSEDGVVEALEAEDRPWLIGVQWHPERTPENDDSKQMFANFIQAAAAYGASKRSHATIR